MNNCSKDFRHSNCEVDRAPDFRSNPNQSNCLAPIGNKSRGKNNCCRPCCCNQTENYTLNIWNWDWDWDFNGDGIL